MHESPVGRGLRPYRRVRVISPGPHHQAASPGGAARQWPGPAPAALGWDGEAPRWGCPGPGQEMGDSSGVFSAACARTEPRGEDQPVSQAIPGEPWF